MSDSEKRTPQFGPATIQLRGFNPYLVMPEALDDDHPPKITFCGSCNFVDEEGQMIRNKGRDVLILWARKNALTHYEVQVHPDTHRRDYNYDTDKDAERTAREIGELRVYEISPSTPSPITFSELMQDAALKRRSIIWLRSGARQFVHPHAGSRGALKMNTALQDAMGPMYFRIFEQLWGGINTLRETTFDFLKTIVDEADGNIVIVEGDDPTLVIEAMKKMLDLDND